MYFFPRFEISFVSNSYRNILHIRFRKMFSYQLDGRGISFLSSLQISHSGVAVFSKVTSKRKC